MDLCLGFFCFALFSCSALLLFFLLCSVKRVSSLINLGSKRSYYHLPGNMNIVQNLMERLRPLVGIKCWDYCVLWKLSEDQRFLEWVDCCCAGTENTENGGDQELFFPVSPVLPCRDVMLQHPRTKSCDLLAQLPSSMPLDSGIYAQTMISNQPRSLNFSNSSDSNAETVGMRILIPAPGGLIELFVDKQVSDNQNVIDFVTSQCSILLEQEAMINSSNMNSSFTVNLNNGTNHELQSNPDQNNPKDPNNHFQQPVSPATALENLNLPYDMNVDRIRLCSSPMNFLHQFNYASENRTNSDNFFEGSYDTMNPFNSSVENGLQEMETLQNPMMHMQFGEALANKEQQANEKESIKQEAGRSESISDCSDQNLDDEEDPKYRRRNGKGPQSKNLVAERKRRKKLNDRLYTLRSLVPNISKLDRASILGDAIEFVKELQKQAKELQDELEENSDNESTMNTGTNGNQKNVQSEILNHNGPNLDHDKAPSGFHLGASGSSPKQNQDLDINTNDKAQQMEVQVEVAQINGNEFFVKVFCEHKPGSFVRLMEALNSLGLEVTNANITSCRSLVSNVFKVEKKRDNELIQADHLRDSLLELTQNPSRGWPEMVKTTENNGNTMDYQQHHHHLHNHHQMSSQHHHHHHLHHHHN